MRDYNFEIGFSDMADRNMFCRVILNPRFTPEGLLEDFPKKITSKFIEALIGPCDYTVAPENSIAISVQNNESMTDVARAIILNLMDFGQDFESNRSNTIDRVIFYVNNANEYNKEKILSKLKEYNISSRLFMNGLMKEKPIEDEDSLDSWPDDLFGYYYYGIKITYNDNDWNRYSTQAKNLLELLHQSNMWNGYNENISACEAVELGRTGISYEIEILKDGISYEVERPSCDPALSINLFYQLMKKHHSLDPYDWEIYLTGAD